MTNSRKTQRSRTSVRRRADYARPTLREFGSIATLTQAGTGFAAEMGMSMSTMQRL